MDINAIIQSARLGQSRKDAQVDACSVFAAAMYDVLREQGVTCEMVTVLNKSGRAWAHSVVMVDARYFDSLGEFSASIYHARAKLHPSVSVDIVYQKDVRSNCYEPEFDEMHAFFVKELNKAARHQTGFALTLIPLAGMARER